MKNYFTPDTNKTQQIFQKLTRNEMLYFEKMIKNGQKIPKHFGRMFI